MNRFRKAENHCFIWSVQLMLHVFSAFQYIIRELIVSNSSFLRKCASTRLLGDFRTANSPNNSFAGFPLLTNAGLFHLSCRSCV